jgi:hypothetical protein
MKPDQVWKWLRRQSKGFCAMGFDTLVKRWDVCINVVEGYDEKEKFFPGLNICMFYVLYPFVTYLLTLPNKYIELTMLILWFLTFSHCHVHSPCCFTINMTEMWLHQLSTWDCVFRDICMSPSFEYNQFHCEDELEWMWCCNGKLSQMHVCIHLLFDIGKKIFSQSRAYIRSNISLRNIFLLTYDKTK